MTRDVTARKASLHRTVRKKSNNSATTKQPNNQTTKQPNDDDDDDDDSNDDGDSDDDVSEDNVVGVLGCIQGRQLRRLALRTIVWHWSWSLVMA